MKPIVDPWTAAPPEVQSCVQRLRSLVPHLVARIRPDASLASCAFDSLELVELLCAIETACGVRLGMDDADTSTTGAALFANIAHRSLPTPVPALP